VAVACVCLTAVLALVPPPCRRRGRCEDPGDGKPRGRWGRELLDADALAVCLQVCLTLLGHAYGAHLGPARSPVVTFSRLLLYAEASHRYCPPPPLVPPPPPQPPPPPHTPPTTPTHTTHTPTHPHTPSPTHHPHPPPHQPHSHPTNHTPHPPRTPLQLFMVLMHDKADLDGWVAATAEGDAAEDPSGSGSIGSGPGTSKPDSKGPVPAARSGLSSVVASGVVGVAVLGLGMSGGGGRQSVCMHVLVWEARMTPSNVAAGGGHWSPFAPVAWCVHPDRSLGVGGRASRPLPLPLCWRCAFCDLVWRCVWEVLPGARRSRASCSLMSAPFGAACGNLLLSVTHSPPRACAGG
jgi:hypothetical protein